MDTGKMIVEGVSFLSARGIDVTCIDVDYGSDSIEFCIEVGNRSARLVFNFTKCTLFIVANDGRWLPLRLIEAYLDVLKGLETKLAEIACVERRDSKKG